MRMRAGVIGLLVVASAIGASWAAPPSGKVVSTAPQTEQVSVAPPGTIRGPKVGPSISALSANECTNLGGKVYDDPIGVGASKKICATTDNYGKNHHVCLSATAGNVW